MDINTELAFLDQIQALIEKRSRELERRMTQRQDADRLMARQIYDEGLIERDNAQAELANLTAEMTQNQQLYAAEYREHTALKRLTDSPYFAAIGFRFDDNPIVEENFRIGLMGISDEEDFTPYIIDWRSPLAGVYYEFNRGRASYNSPGGVLSGLLSEKKQVVIRHGKLLRIFDTDEEVQDEILQEILSRSASTQMHNIVATLQRDQNRLVRINPKLNLLIQGAAGSGKTSIAMHRAAYLLYKDPSLEARHILLLTPNEQLAAYVSEVLPDLGEENARQQLWVDPFLEELSHREARMEKIHVRLSPPAKRRAAASFALIDAIEAFTREDAKLVFEAETIEVGDYLIPDHFIRSLYHDNYSGLPPMLRAAQMIDNIRNYVSKESGDRGRKFGSSRGEIESSLAAMYADANLTDLLMRFTNWLTSRDEWKSLYGGLSTDMDGRVVYDEVDITVMTYLKIFYYGIELDWPVRHLILDEMQDVLPLAHRVLQMLFPCPKTVLGDMNQAILFRLEEGYLDKLAALYRAGGAKLEQATLLQAYRSTYQITEFSKSLLDLDDILSFERHGLPVRLKQAGSANKCEQAGLDDVIKTLRKEIASLADSEWQNCAVICRNEVTTALLNEAIPSPETAGPKWRLLTLAESKGLEFDAVILVHLDGTDALGHVEENEDPEKSRRIRWYVAATRALHQLIILCQNHIPVFLEEAIAGGLIENTAEEAEKLTMDTTGKLGIDE